MFWRSLGFSTTSPVDVILEKGDYTLESLLDEEDILQECKANNSLLLDFLTQAENITTMIKYLHIPPGSSSSSDADSEEMILKNSKYAHTVSDLLSCDNSRIIDSFFDSEDSSILDLLFQFLDWESDANTLFVNYCVRVASNLVMKRFSDTVSYIHSQINFIPKLVKHIGNSSVLDFLVKLVECEDTEPGVGIVKWLLEQNLVDLLLDVFSPDHTYLEHENVGRFFENILVLQSPEAVGSISAILESSEAISKLFENVFCNQNNQIDSESESNITTTALIPGIQILTNWFRKNAAEKYDDMTPLHELPTLFRMTLAKGAFFCEMLKASPSNSLISQQNYDPPLAPVVGLVRLKLVECMCQLYQTRYQIVENELFQCGIVSQSIALLFEYTNNSLLHKLVSDWILSILQGQNEGAKEMLVTQCSLVTRITAADAQNTLEVEKDDSSHKNENENTSKEIEKVEEKEEKEEEGSKNVEDSNNNINDEKKNIKKKSRLGHMGAVSLIACNVIQAAENFPSFASLLLGNDVWKKYAEGNLKERIKLESVPLGGMKPVVCGNVDSIDDLHNDEDEEDDEMKPDSDFGNYEQYRLSFSAQFPTDSDATFSEYENGEMTSDTFDEFDNKTGFTVDASSFGLREFAWGDSMDQNKEDSSISFTSYDMRDSFEDLNVEEVDMGSLANNSSPSVQNVVEFGSFENKVIEDEVNNDGNVDVVNNVNIDGDGDIDDDDDDQSDDFESESDGSGDEEDEPFPKKNAWIERTIVDETVDSQPSPSSTPVLVESNGEVPHENENEKDNTTVEDL